MMSKTEIAAKCKMQIANYKFQAGCLHGRSALVEEVLIAMDRFGNVYSYAGVNQDQNLYRLERPRDMLYNFRNIFAAN
jgi:hypothetical protein